MATLMNKTTKQIITGDVNFYTKKDEWYPVEWYGEDGVYNEKILPVGIPKKYWKWEDKEETFVEMNASEKSQVDLQIAQAEAKALDDSRDITKTDPLIKHTVYVLLEEINELRTKAGLIVKTIEQITDAIKNKFGG